jgi:hypothetical protein
MMLYLDGYLVMLPTYTLAINGNFSFSYSDFRFQSDDLDATDLS